MSVASRIGEILSPSKRSGTISFEVMDSTGHTKTTWNADEPAEVEAAKKQFDELTAKGYTAFQVKRGGEAGERMKKFDKDAEAVIFTKAVQGG